MDTELVVRAQHGDQGAFVTLALGVGDRLQAVAHRVLRDFSLAEDATQAALLAMWRDLPQLRDPSRFEGWAYRLLLHACYAEARRARRGGPVVQLVPANEPAGTDGIGVVIDRDQLERGFQRLSLEHRAVIVLHYFADLSLDQIGETLGIPPGTARSRLHHAMRSLRAALEADERPAAREARP